MTDEAAESRRPDRTTGAEPGGAAPPSVPDDDRTAENVSSGDGPPAPPPTEPIVPPTEPIVPAAGPEPTAGPTAAPGASWPPPGPGPGPGPGAGPTPGHGPFAGFTFPSWNGIVRPREGRYVAGVCAGIGRATNTDPVLWRVLLAVLGFFGGAGILLYLAAWLLLPDEGDDASPVEAMLGRGRSSTNSTTALVLAVLTAVAFVFIISDGFRAALLVGAIVAGGALLLKRNAAAGTTAGPTTGAAVPPPAATPPGADEAVTSPLPPVPGVPAPDLTAPMPPLPPMPPGPAAPGATAFGPPPPVSGYRPPFAPHGPYGGPRPGPRPAPAVWAPKPPRARSRLGRVTFFLILLTIGAVALADLTGRVPVSAPTYFAAALLIIALGLLIGVWFGRARGLIALGLIAILGLTASSAADEWLGPHAGRTVTWQPRTVDSMDVRYSHGTGKAILDLRSVDFTGRQAATAVHLNVGRLQIKVPPQVDVVSTVNLDVGEARVFNDTWNGFDTGAHEVTDTGADGPGGGNLRLDVTMDVGNVEVTR